MVDKSLGRGKSRDRHSRGIRQPLLSPLFRNGARGQGFEQIVASTCEFLKSAWPEQLSNLSYKIYDAPAFSEGVESVRRWSIRKDATQIIIYRLPIERMGHFKRSEKLHERMHIEEYVFTAAAALIGKEPWELIPGADER
ncbi:hypothetical protein [Rhodoluna sp.]|uniref:hypothetical protein n=1 Tax=Rhodoluna sp. TaxID=1969481 RepID=UPI0025F10A90|nr:hypothetical protein [Rhodoluna sp.]